VAHVAAADIAADAIIVARARRVRPSEAARLLGGDELRRVPLRCAAAHEPRAVQHARRQAPPPALPVLRLRRQQQKRQQRIAPMMANHGEQRAMRTQRALHRVL